MYTKTQVETLINTLIDNGLNKALKVREILKGIFFDTIFPAVLREQSSTPSTNIIIGTPKDGYSFDIQFKRVGNTVFMQGRIFNNSGIQSGLSLVPITNALFQPIFQPHFSATMINLSDLSTKSVHGTISSNEIWLINASIPANNYIVFNCHYNVNDN
jgi:hypothetical protein